MTETPLKPAKTLFQCDFDGTITVNDISFLILDRYARGDWRGILELYKKGDITVGEFNSRAFSLVNEDRETLTGYVLDNYRIRPGFNELLNYCKDKNYRFIIVSNGLDFYIKAIINDLGLSNLETRSAKARFGQNCIDAVYEGPDGNVVADGFKEAFSRHFINQGYRIIYAGNGASDAPAARLAHHAFATESLVKRLDEVKAPFFQFDNLGEIVTRLRELNGS